ncbi:enoyl-ACP reductase-like protein [Kribbella steppae]|uniref:Enoyl-ACP reductase-like protein n=1 Tax=Kribbella steppae TaxID=2512223 RepID=A0A4R2H4H5_9ACTN|nr:SDR family oxidoreductase [Kribbella steppae]TCO19665.1 enoyl-ACP reductase-like protein [Kribbella steppae]
MSAQVAMVVGAGGELGRATAAKLAGAGFTVVGVDRNADGLKLLPDGIRVNAVAPAQLDTDKTRPYLPPELLAHTVKPEAVAEIIAFLVSDAAAAVSGAIVPTYGA